ncbi:MAG: cell division protein FtsL [Gammaproteobacteria bacterium]|nr:cell division protein FtsL [Gammaproteobacteria bacterium]
MKVLKPPRVWIIALAALVVFVNALAVAYSAADNRANYSRLMSLRKAHDQLVVRRGQLELEVLTLAAHARVARLAEVRMNMGPPEKVRIVRVP